MANTREPIYTARVNITISPAQKRALEAYVSTHPIYRSASEAVRSMVEKELGE